MLKFLQSLLADWVALVSGIASFLLALIGAIFATSLPSWVFWPAAYACLIVAAYRLWKSTTATAAVNLAERESEWQKKQEDLTTKYASLEQRTMELEAALVAQNTTHQAELHRVRTSDVRKNAIRSHVEQRICQFEEMKARASREAVPARELYPLEQATDEYLKKWLPEYVHFCDEFSIKNSHGGQEMVTRGEAIGRCDARLKRLREVLDIVA